MSEPTWESIADWYAAKLSAGSPTHEWFLTILLAELPDLHGQPVLDLGCGTGLCSRSLAKRGAKVTGVDLSERMLAHARRQEAAHPLGIDYRLEDAGTLEGLPDTQFAGVVANLLLNAVPDLDSVTAAVHRVLRPGGWLVFTIPHPCFETPHAAWGTTPDGRPGRIVNRYFDEAFWRSTNPQGVRRVGVWHRPIGAYLNTLVEHGFAVTRVAEPRPDAAVAATYPGRVEVALGLLVRATR